MALSTLVATGVLYSDRRDFYIDPARFAELYPNVSPFLSGLFAMGPESTPDPDFKMFESRAGWRQQYFYVNDATPSTWTATGGPADTLLDLTIDNVTGLTMDSSQEGQECEVWDSTLTTYKGNVIITTVDSATQIDIKSLGKPDHATFVVSALANNDVFYVRTPAIGEGQTAPDAFAHELQVVWNSAQIIRTSLELTGTLATSTLRGAADERSRLRTLKSNAHKASGERALLYGMRPDGIGGVAHGAGAGTDSTHVDTSAPVTDSGSNTVRTTMGIINVLRRYGRTSGDQQNVFSPTEASYSFSDMVDDFEKVFQYMPQGGNKVMYAGPGFVSFLAKQAAQGMKDGFTVNWNSSSSSIGVKISELITPHGSVDVVKAPLMDGPYNKYAVVVNPDNVKLVQFRSDRFSSNIKTEDGYDGMKDEFFSDFGLGIQLAESHALFKLQG
jgi:hypothetical protein